MQMLRPLVTGRFVKRFFIWENTLGSGRAAFACSVPSLGHSCCASQAPFVAPVMEEKPRIAAGLLGFAPGARVPGRRVLLGGGHFFGFAFLAHHFEFAFGFLVGGLDLLLDAGCRFFKLG